MFTPFNLCPEGSDARPLDRQESKLAEFHSCNNQSSSDNSDLQLSEDEQHWLVICPAEQLHSTCAELSRKTQAVLCRECVEI